LERTKEKSISGLLVFAIIVAVLAVFSAGFPAAMIALPLVLAYMMARFGFSGAGLGIVALAAAVFFRPNAAIAFVLAAAPVSAAAAWSARKRRRFRDSVISASTAALIGLSLVFGLIWLLRGITPVEFIVNGANGFFGLFSDTEVNLAYQSARMLDIQTGAITQQAVLATPRAEAISTMLTMLRETVNASLVSTALSYSLLCGLLCYLIARSGAKKTGVVPLAIPVFSDYALPKGFWAAFLVSYVAALGAESLKWIPSGMLAPTILSVYSFLFIVQALSFADFLYKDRGIRPGIRVGVHIVTVLVFGNYLMWVGIFENIVQFRRRSQEKGGEEF
jgi:uncharacterized membrane protein